MKLNLYIERENEVLEKIGSEYSVEEADEMMKLSHSISFKDIFEMFFYCDLCWFEMNNYNMLFDKEER